MLLGEAGVHGVLLAVRSVLRLRRCLHLLVTFEDVWLRIRCLSGPKSVYPCLARASQGQVSRAQFQSQCLRREGRRGCWLAKGRGPVCGACRHFEPKELCNRKHGRTQRGFEEGSQIQLGVWGALGAPEDFEINAFQRLRTPVSLSFLSQCCYTKIHAISSYIIIRITSG